MEEKIMKATGKIRTYIVGRWGKGTPWSNKKNKQAQT